MFYVCSDRILPFSLNGIILVFSVSCSVSFSAHHQPEGHFVPAATKHDHLILIYKLCVCTKIATCLQFRPHLHAHCVFSTFSYMHTEITEVKTRKPKWPSNLKPTKMWISSKPLGDTLQTCQDWHRKMKLVFFGFSCHGNVPWSQENPHGVSHALGSTIFSSSVTRRLYIDMTLQIKGGDKSPHLLLAGGDNDKRSELSNLTAGAVKGVCCKNTC